MSGKFSKGKQGKPASSKFCLWDSVPLFKSKTSFCNKKCESLYKATAK